MYPVQLQEGTRGIGMGYGQFVAKFTMLCQEHLREGRAKIFAFVFYDAASSVVQRALKEVDGFHLLHKKTGRDITLFYLHDGAVKAHSRRFNKHFMAALGIKDQAEPPCMVFFRVHGELIEDVAIYKIDEQTQDPVLVAAELEHYVDDAIKRMNAEGNFSALTGMSKLVAPISAFTKLAEFLLRLKGFA